ncbi:cytosine permease [Quadrisphaera sp. INWT6]|uniref:purine-cytosine permease family protein n=1 Tax=Quadrisphaera sp. INWT6 TaxID=2596917 RepID=UPI0018921AEA|nr:cytosine permease [Quadrisphaera sp. INWT6]MBF5082028.1 allantoin permease [Quadrisphaera sp. INWT6]
MSSTTPVPARVEANGLNVIDESERRGRPSSLFWPWFAANVSVFGIANGAFVLGFGLSWWQALLAGVVGILASFLLCGLVALGGTRASAPTMVVSRAAFGVRGNRLPSAISWLLTVGWETVLVSLAALATATVFTTLGWGGGTITKAVALLLVVLLVVGAGVLGFDAIMRLQALITVVTGVLTVVFLVLAAEDLSWSAVSAVPNGSWQALLGATVFAMTLFGLGWVNAAGDYSRYLPRHSSRPGVVWWTTFGGATAPLVLASFGVLLAASSPEFAAGVNTDPIGALAAGLPVWFLVPFALVAVLSLVGGAVLDIYSSGLALLSLGLPAPRWAAALVDGALMVAGAVYVVFASEDFLTPFQGFLITLGVPIAGWAGAAIADLVRRSGAYDDAALFDPAGPYGSVRWGPVALLLAATAVGWGLVVNSSATWLTWQGYLLEPLGLGGRDGAWAYANLGVLAALVIGFGGQLLLTPSARKTLRTGALGRR